MITRTILPAALDIYDQLNLLRGQLLSNIGVQFLIALFFIASLFVAIILFVYWGSCAFHVLSANGVQLTDAEVEPMLWGKKLRAHLFNLFNGSVLALS
jgi:hypothetical protein